MKTSQKEVRILCKQDTRESRPSVMRENNLFLLPIKNGIYAIIRGEGYLDIPEIEEEPIPYESKLNFDLETSKSGNSEMQHLDFAYATSVIRSFMGDSSLVLTIRGRKYSKKISFNVGSQKVEVVSVQTEVDAGYEGENSVVLVEAKNSKTKNTIIRQLFYPFKHWSTVTNKKVTPLFFEKRGKLYSIWEYEFKNPNDYNSIRLVRSKRYEIL